MGRDAEPARRFGALGLAMALLTPAFSAAQIPEQDRRNTEIRHTDRHYSMRTYTRAEWEARSAFLRKQVLFAAGLFPLPGEDAAEPAIRRAGRPR